MILIIGYGNTLRRDDGVGQLVADRIGRLNWPNVRSLAVHQLTPELVEAIAQSERVIFVDAFPCQQKQVQVKTLKPEAGGLNLGHHLDPYSLLFLCERLYQKSPLAWWILVPAVNFDFGETLSPVSKNGMEEAIKQISALID